MNFSFDRFYFDCPCGGSVIFIRNSEIGFTYTDNFKIVVILVLCEPIYILLSTEIFKKGVNGTLLIFCR